MRFLKLLLLSMVLSPLNNWDEIQAQTTGLINIGTLEELLVLFFIKIKKRKHNRYARPYQGV